MKRLVYKLYVAAAIAYIGVELAELLVERIAERVAQRLDWRFRNLVDIGASVHEHLSQVERGIGQAAQAKK